MKLSILARIALPGFAVLLVLPGCTLDASMWVKPQPVMSFEKATVEPGVVTAVSSDTGTIAVSVKSQQQNIVVPEVATPQKQLPEPVSAEISRPVVQASPVAERQRVVAAPDFEYRNTVLAEDTLLKGLVQVTGWL